MGSQGSFGVAVCFVLRASGFISSVRVSRDTAACPTYRSGTFEFLEEPRHGERRGDQAPGASLGRRGRSPSWTGSRGQCEAGSRRSTIGQAIRRQPSGRCGQNSPAVVRGGRNTRRGLRVLDIGGCAHRGGGRVQVAQFTRSLGAVVRDMRGSGRRRSWTDRADAGTKTDAGNTNGINVAPGRNKNELHRGLSKAHGQGWAAKGVEGLQLRRGGDNGQASNRCRKQEACRAGHLKGTLLCRFLASTWEISAKIPRPHAPIGKPARFQKSSWRGCGAWGTEGKTPPTLPPVLDLLGQASVQVPTCSAHRPSLKPATDTDRRQISCAGPSFSSTALVDMHYLGY